MITPAMIFGLFVLLMSIVSLLDVGTHATKAFAARSEAVSLRYAAEDLDLNEPEIPSEEDIAKLRDVSQMLAASGGRPDHQASRLIAYVIRDGSQEVLWQTWITAPIGAGELEMSTSDDPWRGGEIIHIGAVIDYSSHSYLIPFCEDICSILSD